MHRINRIARINHDLLAEAVSWRTQAAPGSQVSGDYLVAGHNAYSDDGVLMAVKDIHHTEKSFHSGLAI